MFKKYLITGFIFLIISCISPENKKQLSIVSYNVQNLFDDIDNGTEYKSYDPGRSDWNSEKYRTKLNNISFVLNKINADIIALQEIENSKVLEDLRNNYMESSEYRYSYATDFPGSAINLGIISRIKAESVKTHNLSYRDRKLRGIQELVFRISGHELVIFNNHWKSKSGGAEQTEKLRIEYSELLKSRIKAISSEKAEVIVLGDLNENHNEYERIDKKYPTAFGPCNMQESDLSKISIILGNSDCIGDDVFFSPWFDSKVNGSYKYKESWESIDHFILTKTLFDNKHWEYKSFEVFDDDFLMTKKGYPKKWLNYKSSGYSDHLPIVLELEFCESFYRKEPPMYAESAVKL